MPAEHHIDKENKLIVTIWNGDAEIFGIADAMAKYQKEIQSNPACESFNELVNLQGITGLGLTTESIKSLVQLASKSDVPNQKKKLAIVVGSAFVYGIARMYQAYRKASYSSAKSVCIFREESEALEWLNQRTV